MLIQCQQIINYFICLKMKAIIIFLAITLIIAQVDARYRPSKVKAPTSPPENGFIKHYIFQINSSTAITTHKFAQKQYVFDKPVDHSNYQDNSFWKQRYWVINDYFLPKVGPVYIFLCGQWICQGIDQYRQWVLTLAQKTGGLVIVLEHRFYGESLPFGQDSFKIENLKMLSSQQALSDIAYFITRIGDNGLYGINNNPWITVGGSYPGALAAWFRYKYPHLTIGAIASSAVVQAIQNFQDFDQQMYLSAMKSGEYCQKAINESSTRVEYILNSSIGQDFKRLFEGGINLKDDQFLFFWVDAIVMKVQYGERTVMCDALKNKSAQDQFDYFVQEAKQHQVYEYGSYYLKNDTIPSQTENGEADRITARAWYYQSCTQFGFWQTPSKYSPLRSQKLNLDFYRRFCADSYGEGTWPYAYRKNIETGGWNLQATNLFMVNGDEDPWKWASAIFKIDGVIIREADCQNCGHVPELYTPRISDPPELKKIRDQQFLTVQEWIEDYWRKVNHQKVTRSIEKGLISQ